MDAHDSPPTYTDARRSAQHVYERHVNHTKGSDRAARDSVWGAYKTGLSHTMHPHIDKDLLDFADLESLFTFSHPPPLHTGMLSIYLWPSDSTLNTMMEHVLTRARAGKAKADDPAWVRCFDRVNTVPPDRWRPHYVRNAANWDHRDPPTDEQVRLLATEPCGATGSAVPRGSTAAGAAAGPGPTSAHGAAGAGEGPRHAPAALKTSVPAGAPATAAPPLRPQAAPAPAPPQSSGQGRQHGSGAEGSSSRAAAGGGLEQSRRHTGTSVASEPSSQTAAASAPPPPPPPPAPAPAPQHFAPGYRGPRPVHRLPGPPLAYAHLENFLTAPGAEYALDRIDLKELLQSQRPAFNKHECYSPVDLLAMTARLTVAAYKGELTRGGAKLACQVEEALRDQHGLILPDSVSLRNYYVRREERPLHVRWPGEAHLRRIWDYASPDPSEGDADRGRELVALLESCHELNLRLGRRYGISRLAEGVPGNWRSLGGRPPCDMAELLERVAQVEAFLRAEARRRFPPSSPPAQEEGGGLPNPAPQLQGGEAGSQRVRWRNAADRVPLVRPSEAPDPWAPFLGTGSQEQRGRERERESEHRRRGRSGSRGVSKHQRHDRSVSRQRGAEQHSGYGRDRSMPPGQDGRGHGGRSVSVPPRQADHAPRHRSISPALRRRSCSRSTSPRRRSRSRSTSRELRSRRRSTSLNRGRGPEGASGHRRTALGPPSGAAATQQGDIGGLAGYSEQQLQAALAALAANKVEPGGGEGGRGAGASGQERGGGATGSLRSASRTERDGAEEEHSHSQVQRDAWGDEHDVGDYADDDSGLDDMEHGHALRALGPFAWSMGDDVLPPAHDGESMARIRVFGTAHRRIKRSTSPSATARGEEAQ